MFYMYSVTLNKYSVYIHGLNLMQFGNYAML